MKILPCTHDRRAVFPIIRWIIKEPEKVVTALKLMGPVAEDEVVKLLREKNADARKHAARILEEIGTGKSLAELHRASNDPRDKPAAEAAKLAEDTVRARVKEKKPATQP
jgi:HEAT repeat protein